MFRSPSSALLTFLGWEGSPTKIDCGKKGTLILASLLEEVDVVSPPVASSRTAALQASKHISRMVFLTNHKYDQTKRNVCLSRRLREQKGA